MQKIPLSTLALGSMAAMGALGPAPVQAEEQAAPATAQEPVVLSEAEMDEVTAGARVFADFENLDFTAYAYGDEEAYIEFEFEVYAWD